MLLDGDYERRPAIPKNKGVKLIALLIGVSIAGLLLLAALLAGSEFMKIAFWMGKGG